MEIEADEVVDARDLMCPMPVLARDQGDATARTRPGAQGSWPPTGAPVRHPAWAQDTDNELQSSGTEDGALTFYIRNAPNDE